jgi:hypothetical protein
MDNSLDKSFQKLNSFFEKNNKHFPDKSVFDFPSKISSSLESLNKRNIGLTSILDIAINYDKFNSIKSNGINTFLNNEKLAAKNNLLNSSNFSNILKISLQNEALAEKLSAISNSHSLVSSKLDKLIYAKDWFNKKSINPINDFLTGTTNSFISQAYHTQDFNNIEVLTSVNEAVSATVDNYITNDDTILDQKELLESIRGIFKETISGTKESTKNKMIDILFKLMAFISFTLAMTNYFIKPDNKTMSDFLGDIFEEIKESITEIGVEEVGFKIHQRFCLIDTRLKIYPKKRTEEILTIPAGRKVLVIGTYRKYLLVSYCDDEISMVSSGYVLKKHFKKFK